LKLNKTKGIEKASEKPMKGFSPHSRRLPRNKLQLAPSSGMEPIASAFRKMSGWGCDAAYLGS
jgi:hypothetical protein